MTRPLCLVLALLATLVAAPAGAQSVRVGVQAGGRSQRGFGAGVRAGVQAGGRAQHRVDPSQPAWRPGRAGGAVHVGAERRDWQYRTTGFRHTSWPRRAQGFSGPTYTFGTSPRRATTVYVAPQPCPPTPAPRRVRLLRFPDGTTQAAVVASGEDAYDTPAPYVVVAPPIYPGQAPTRMTEARARAIAADEAASAAPAPAPERPRKPSLAERLQDALQAGDLGEACRIAAWAQDDPRREQALQAALYRRFPSPQLLAQSAKRLRALETLRDAPGRATLARLLGPVPADE